MILFDYSNLLEENVKEHGLPKNFIERHQGLIKEAHHILSRGLPFIEILYKNDYLSSIKKFSRENQGRWENLVVFGIGGSCLGPLALHLALNHPFHNIISKEKRDGLPRAFFLDNIDPELIFGLLESIEIKNTLFLVISKSGKTSETLAQFLIALERLKDLDLKRQVVIITDPEKGPLRKICNEEGYTSFPIPPALGGRYSVLSPVGLVSSALLGIDIDALILGARDMAERCKDIKDNPAYVFALSHYLLYKEGKNIHILMPYINALGGIADWFCQLWAESLGKRYNINKEEVFCGPTPIKAIGVKDQHSQLQLYMEGPYDKVITFLTAKDYRSYVNIPTFYPDIIDISFLGNHTLNELIKAEQIATEAALTSERRPNAKFVLDRVDPFNLGGLFVLFEIATATFGTLCKINPFDQPGVELGKLYTHALMGKPNLDKEKEEIEKFLKRPIYQV